MRTLFLILIVIGLPVRGRYAAAQQIGGWAAHTSVRTVRGGIAINDTDTWTLTAGGLAIYTNSGLQRVLTTIDGLSRLDGTAIAHNSGHSLVFVAYLNGRIDVIDTEKFTVQTLTDIERSVAFNSKAIHDMLVYENTLFVATDFGIVDYNIENLYVRDTYTKLGRLSRATPVLSLFSAEGKLVAGTNEGLALASINSDFSENEWTVYDAGNGFLSSAVTAVGLFKSKIYATTDGKNYVFDGTGWITNPDITADNVLAYQNLQNDELLALTENRLFRIFESGAASVSLSDKQGISLLKTTQRNAEIWYGTEDDGPALVDTLTGEVTTLSLNGPFRNNFEGIAFDGDIMISGSTRQSVRNLASDRAKGYYIFDGEHWTNYNYFTNEVLKASNTRLIFSTLITDDYYYFGSWGHGVVRHSKENGEVVVFNEKNSTLRGWESDDPFYPVITGLGKDTDGDVWLVSRYGTTPLYMQTPGNDDWTPFYPDAAVGFGDFYENLFVDSFNRKWIPLQNSSTAGTGLLVLDTGKTSDPNDDKGVKLTTNENSGNLPNNKIKAIVEDKNGEIWIGTERGVAKFLFPDLLIDGNAGERKAQWLINDDTTAVSRYLLRDANVTAMAVNAANEKWIGSQNQGIWVVNEEGSRIIKRFTKENSPLFSDNIISISINDLDGKVYIATDAGLLSYQDVPKKPVAKMKELKVFPNPFSYDKYSEIRIEGLSESTTINIVGVDGTVVNTLTEKGGRASWNGRDYNGNRLGTGVYYVIATRTRGNNRGVGKIIIVN